MTRKRNMIIKLPDWMPRSAGEPTPKQKELAEKKKRGEPITPDDLFPEPPAPDKQEPSAPEQENDE